MPHYFPHVDTGLRLLGVYSYDKAQEVAGEVKEYGNRVVVRRHGLARLYEVWAQPVTTRSNPHQVIGYLDWDGVQTLKRQAAELGMGSYIKILARSTANEAWKLAEKAEDPLAHSRKGTRPMKLEVFGVTDKKGVYGYAPEGMVEEAADEARHEWDKEQEAKLARSVAQADRARAGVDAKIAALKGKYTPRMSRLVAQYEHAVNSAVRELDHRGFVDESTKREVKSTAHAITPEVRRMQGGGGLIAAIATFTKVLMETPGERQARERVGNPFGLHSREWKDIGESLIPGYTASKVVLGRAFGGRSVAGRSTR